VLSLIVVKCERGAGVIRLEVPSTLSHRDVALRTVSAACKLLASNGAKSDERDWSEFRMHFVSAVSEAFNNIVIHGYRDRDMGTVRIEIDLGQTSMTVRMVDFGASFDLTRVAIPDLAKLPESGLGIFIIRSFMDSVLYEPGQPNVLILNKTLYAPRQSDVKVASAGERR
jgi:serine/threonine-protein kinase RsbW